MIGTTIGRYRVTGKLGEGGMGTVWRAEDPVLGRFVAIKLLPEHAAESPDAKERLLREARAACSLHHAGIATVYEAGEDEGRLYLAFEHVDGETVAQRVKREGPLPVEEAVRIAREAAEAIGHAHESGVLHRDVTAGNIMLDSKGRVKLVDFGLTLPEEPSRRTRDTTHATPGTIGYIAPEIVKGERGDRRADLYGLGVVLYEMLTGHLPFERDRAEAVLYAVVNEQPVSPRRHRPELTADVEAIVLRAIAKDPAGRFTDASELKRALERRVPAAKGGGGSRRRWTPVRYVLITLGVAAAAFAAWKIFGSDSPRFDSVAVLPFSLPGENAEEIAYLATGLGDALAGRLARVSELRVSPWVTSRRYSPDELPLPDIGEELGVRSLVTGSFQEEAGQIRITLSLVDATTGEPAWSATFADARTALLELQDVICLAVANGVRGRLTPEEEEALTHRSTDRLEAYDQYLRGAAALQAPGIASKKLALAYFETALAIDPRLAEAHVGVGAVHTNACYDGWGGSESATIAEESFHRALAIDPEMLLAFRGLSMLGFSTGRNERCLRIARDLRERSSGQGQVSVDALLAQAEAFLFGGLAGEALPLLEVVARLDPASGAASWFAVLAHLWAGDNANTIRAAEEYLRAFGEDVTVHTAIGLASRCLGNREVALEHLERAREIAGDGGLPGIHGLTALTYRESGRENRAAEVAREGILQLESRRTTGMDNSRLEIFLLELHAIVGDTTMVLEHGSRLLESAPWRSPDHPFALTEPFPLANAFVLVDDRESANRVLLELTGLMRSQSERGLLDAEATDHDDGVFYLSNNLHIGCEDNALVRELPAYPDLMDAFRAEEQRRRKLYGS